MDLNNFTKSLLFAILLSLLSFSGAVAGPMLEAAGKQNWQIQDYKALQTLFPDKAAVDAFIKELYTERGFVNAPTVAEFELTGLSNDGTVQLVIAKDEFGILIVHKINDTFKNFVIWNPGMRSVGNLKSRIVDLNHDGSKEIIVPRKLSVPKFGNDPTPVIEDVYKWNGAGYVKSNALFKDYYRNLLPRLQAALESVREWRRTASDEGMVMPPKREANIRLRTWKVGYDARERAALEKRYEMEIEAINEILNQ